jgi:hypothetical protein
MSEFRTLKGVPMEAQRIHATREFLNDDSSRLSFTLSDIPSKKKNYITMVRMKEYLFPFS